ncbi:helix-turn-helix transcriptional regulator [Streptomyces sp. W1SF4]|uniref:helix-turn-helix domain-containing protein n=1 Tax=Streptomyces sp. W1SF4 TaxID=2305220 RepID=UPI0013E071E3|nr:helix-turn-helix transcriptional regulator [Streptomyces sp. W1SF4]
MAGTDKPGGRPWADIRPVNPGAGRLAAFLRARVEESGKTLAVLAKQIDYSKSQVSTLLSGRIPPQRFVTSLIDATVAPPLRERRRSEAEALLYEATHPPRAAKPAARVDGAAAVLDVAAVQARQIETYDRLTRALEQQAELRQTADNAARLIWILLGMIHELNDRVGALGRERDRAADREALEAARDKLARAESQQAEAEGELGRAEEKKRQAEALAGRLQERIAELTEELDRLRGQGGGPAAPDRLPDLAPSTPPATSADPEGDDFDAALARATAINDTDGDTVHRITIELGGQPALAVVPDNPSTSPDVPNGSVHELRAEAKSAQQDGDFAKAVRLYERLVAASAAHLGPDHPETFRSRYEQAQCTGDAGVPSIARDLTAALVSDETRVLGADHPSTLSSRYQLAYYTGEAGDFGTARDLVAALLPDEAHVLGPDHRSTLTSRYAHAYYTGMAGAPTTAKALYEVLLQDQTRNLGADHPDTLNSRFEHAHFTAAAGAPATARRLLAALIPDRERVLGPGHPHTLVSRFQHAYYTAKAGDPATARDLYAGLAGAQARALGPDHRRTLASRYEHARNTATAGDPAGALDLMTSVVADLERALGPGHPDAVTGREQLAGLRRRAAEAGGSPA